MFASQNRFEGAVCTEVLGLRGLTLRNPIQCSVLLFLLLHNCLQWISLPCMVYVSYTVAASNCSHRDAGKMCLFLPARQCTVSACAACCSGRDGNSVCSNIYTKMQGKPSWAVFSCDLVYHT